MTDPTLTRRELDVMSALWELGEGTVNDVRHKVGSNLAYTTVSTIVRLLEMKGFVSHRRGDGKTHVYFPVIKRETAAASVLRRLIDKVYGGSPVRLIAQLLEDRKFSGADLERMRALLKKPRKKTR
jgi:predicted transcriptional regulator